MNISIKFLDPSQHRLVRYAVALVLMGIALGLRLLIWPVDYGLQYVTFFPAVALTAVFAGFWPGMMNVLLGVLLATFIFTMPYFSISLEAIKNSVWANLVFTIDGVIVCLSIEAMHRFRQKYAKELEDTKISHIRSEQDRQQLEAIVNNVLDGIITIDEHGTILTFNKAATNIFDYAEAEVLHQNISMLIPEPYFSRTAEYIKNHSGKNKQRINGIRREVEGRRRDGSIFPMDLAICEVTGSERIFCGVVRDASERKMRERHMYHLAHHDQLTGLPNRILLNDRISQLLSKARRDNEKLAILFIDLDEFKEINDSLGHDIGDLLLKAVTTRLLDCLRDSDTAARMGGDEFIVLLPAVHNEDDALRVGEKICRSLCQPFTLSGDSLNVSSSIGIAIYPEHGQNEADLLKHADCAMYHAKHLGRNQVSIYSNACEKNVV